MKLRMVNISPVLVMILSEMWQFEGIILKSLLQLLVDVSIDSQASLLEQEFLQPNEESPLV